MISINRRYIRLIAIITMIIDHIGIMLKNSYFRIIGRLSFPIFLFLLVEGYTKTKSYFKYLLRLILLALITEIPYDLFINNSLISFNKQNVIWSFILVLIMLKILDIIKKIDEKIIIKLFYYIFIITLFCMLSIIAKVDYNVSCILLGAALYLFKDYKIKYLLFILIEVLVKNPWGCLAIIFMILYNDKKVDTSKIERVIYYLTYPIQFLLLYFIFV